MAEKIELDIDIASIIQDLKVVRDELGKVGSATKEAFDIGSAQGLADGISDLKSEYNNLKQSSVTLKNALKSATDPQLITTYSKAIAQLEAGMGKLEKTAKTAGVNLKEANQSANTGKQVFENFFGAFTKATIIIAALEAVRKFVTYAVGLSQEIGKAQKSFQAFTGSAEEADKIVNSLIATGQKNFIPTDDILKAGKALLAFGEGASELPDVLGRIADISAATGKDFNELTTIYGKARAAGVLYAEDINQLVDAGIPIIQEFAKQMGVSNDEVKKLASEGKISFEELQLAMFNLTAEGGKFANQANVQSDSISGAWNRAVAVVQPAIEFIGNALGEFIQGALEGFVIVADALRNLFSDAPEQKIEVDYSGRDAYEQAKDDLYERERLEKQADDSRKKRGQKSAEELLKTERDKESARINGMKEGLEKQLAQEDFRFAELKRQLLKYNLDTTEATEQHEKNLEDIRLRYILKEAEAAARKQEELERLRGARDEFEAEQTKKGLDAAKKNIEDIKAIRESEIDVVEQNFENYIKRMKANGASKEEIERAELEFSKAIQEARLQADLEFQERLLIINADGDEATITQIKNRIQKIKAELEGLSIAEGPGEKDSQFSLGKLLGVKDEDLDDFEKAVEFVKNGLKELTQARLEAAEAAVQAAEDEINASQEKVENAEEDLDRQLELASLGFASDVTGAQERLKRAEKEEQEAKVRKEKALQDQKKQQRTQILLDSALQASNIITAATNVYKGFSVIPFVGQVLGAAAVALLIGSFVGAKAKALQATKARDGIQGRVGKSGIVVGPSHEGGGVPLEVEGNEFVYQDGQRISVVNRRATAQHFGLLQAINNDDRPAMATYLDRLTGGVRRNPDVGAAPSGAGNSASVSMKIADPITHKLFEENNRLQRKLVEIEEARETIIDMGDYILIRRKGREERIEKRRR